MLSCILFEDEHLLVINKPAGMNTHAPSPYAGEGLYDWLKHREPRWARLSIIHRLDKETSGVLVFGKTPLANRSLTAQFTGRAVTKKYLLLTDGTAPKQVLRVRSQITRSGDRYCSGSRGDSAETIFTRAVSESPVAGTMLLSAEPLTGRTHQIRVHAAENGFPILGDTLYGGAGFPRLCLHAFELGFEHPVDGKPLRFSVPVDFQSASVTQLREAVVEPEQTNAFRLIHGGSDGSPGWFVDRLGPFLLSQSAQPLTAAQQDFLENAIRRGRDQEPAPAKGVYHKILNRQVRRASAADASPQFVSGEPAREKFVVRENGAAFELSFNEGYSVGLFLDQRDNRRRLLTGHIAAGFALPAAGEERGVPGVLNLFSYTCGFSVCAARSGARTTSIDLSKKYLDWGRRNFALNGLDPDVHDFIYGDAFDWMRRLLRKKRLFDLIILDPPTFSQSRETGVFRVERDLERLVSAALPLLRRGGVLLASCNAADWAPSDFVESVLAPVRHAGLRPVQQHYVPQPPDFPVSRAEPAYLKTLWLRIQ